MTATASDLRHRVAFYTRVPASPPPPDYGQTEGEWSPTPSFTVAAWIQPRLGGERVLQARLTGVNMANITIRQSVQTRTITTAWKAVDARSGIEYAIRSIIDPDYGTPKQGAYFEMLGETGVQA